MTFEQYASKRLGIDPYYSYFVDKPAMVIIQKMAELAEEYSILKTPYMVVEVLDDSFRKKLIYHAKKFNVTIESKGKVLWIYGNQKDIEELNNHCKQIFK